MCQRSSNGRASVLYSEGCAFNSYRWLQCRRRASNRRRKLVLLTGLVDHAYQIGSERILGQTLFHPGDNQSPCSARTCLSRGTVMGEARQSLSRAAFRRI